MPDSFLILSFFTGTHQGFLFISFQKAVDTGTQRVVKTLQSSLTTLHHTIGSLLLSGNSAQLRMQGINRIISIEYSIRSNFKGCLHLNSRIFAWRNENFSQTAEEAFLLRLCHNRIAAGNNPTLYTLLGDNSILFGNNLFHFTG